MNTNSLTNKLLLESVQAYTDNEDNILDILLRCREVHEFGYVYREFLLSQFIPENISFTELVDSIAMAYENPGEKILISKTDREL